MKCEPCWVIRFEGALTQGPSAGKAYSWETSWGGAVFGTVEEARAKLAEYRQREPSLSYRLLRRQFIGGRKGRFVETEEASV